LNARKEAFPLLHWDTSEAELSALAPVPRKKNGTMYNYNSSMSEFFLVDSLGIDKGLAKEGPHRRRLVESDDAIVCTHFLERTQHCILIPIW
jgi:hypothetical protein